MVASTNDLNSSFLKKEKPKIDSPYRRQSTSNLLKDYYNSQSNKGFYSKSKKKNSKELFKKFNKKKSVNPSVSITSLSSFQKRRKSPSQAETNFKLIFEDENEKKQELDQTPTFKSGGKLSNFN